MVTTMILTMVTATVGLFILDRLFAYKEQQDELEQRRRVRIPIRRQDSIEHRQDHRY